MTEFDETALPAEIRDRLAVLRACNNVASVTVKSASALGAIVVLIPTEHVADGGGWAMPNEPHIMLIPNRPN